ncbi:MAG: hypothetical protein P8O08_16045, partial [Paracoccaceae bacterium]|nr:hypothetical protein [Paracoccaceae bacterium]
KSYKRVCLLRLQNWYLSCMSEMILFLGKTPLLPLKFIHLNLVKVAWNKCLFAAPHIMSKPALIKAYEYAS